MMLPLLFLAKSCSCAFTQEGSAILFESTKLNFTLVSLEKNERVKNTM